MFTGIVEELGEVVALERGETSARLTVRGPLVTGDAVHGASIAVDGCCLTVVDIARDDDGAPTGFTADAMLETLERTTLGRLRPGDRVDLERPVAAGGRLGGHVVQGHVDGVGEVAARVPGDRWEVVTVSVPAELAKYVVEKGSVAVDGVSLTVTAVSAAGAERAWFSVSLIPETLRATTLGRKGVGDPVNLEVDVLAKHVERLLADRAVAGLGSGLGAAELEEAVR
ncbi:riboflavin synthase [Quadrisphaera setariae]|uniref:Riboflavin synthase n=1 Tax=Quadrisphaera setariae TaxID=2593304 RepID=A0A5C8ZJ39_9ACTN|nr:riboflavin synthase [Quadrisphaera setariae]TXR57887.1 riboflavin synthase [Quadrisphaera setariae]